MSIRAMTWLVLTAACVPCLAAAQRAYADHQAERIARLIDQLGADDLDQQADAQRQLEKFGEPAQSALLAAMDKHEDITVRAKAQSVFTRIYTAKANLLVAVTKDLTGRVQAGRLVKELAPLVGGGGGGRPDFAEAGGKDPGGIDNLLAKAPEVLRSQIQN